MKRRTVLKGLGTGTVATTLGAGSAVASGGGDVGTTEEKPECQGYKYCANCRSLKYCDERDCAYVCDE